MVKVPDPRLDALAGIYRPKKTVHATIEFVDVVGLKKGESGSTQFTTNFFNNVKNNDALVQVVRAFTNDAVPHPDGTTNVVRDVATLETEFLLADLAIVETRIDRLKNNSARPVTPRQNWSCRCSRNVIRCWSRRNRCVMWSS